MRWWKSATLVLLTGCATDYESILALDGDEVRGQFTYESNCASCHGVDGLGVTGPSLVERIPTLTGEQILEAIDTGPGDMPAFKSEFSDQDFADVLEYVTLTFQ
jgi:mono/diheme cytochrome c family protein